MKRGPKRLTPEQKKARGETRPSQSVVWLYPPNEGEALVLDLKPPSGMTPAARKIWKQKLEEFKDKDWAKRFGFQEFVSGLRMLCECEAMVWDAFKKGGASSALQGRLQSLLAAFHALPSERVVPGRAASLPSNPFANNGRRAAG